MLYVLFSNAEEIDGVNLYPGQAFNELVENSWLNNSFAKNVIKSIDNCTHIKDKYIECPIFGAIPPTELSGTVKTILLLYNTNIATDLCFVGDNGFEFVYEVSTIKDVYCSCSSGFVDFSRCKNFKAYCLNDNTLIQDMESWVEKFVDFTYKPLSKQEIFLRRIKDERSS